MHKQFELPATSRFGTSLEPCDQELEAMRKSISNNEISFLHRSSMEASYLSHSFSIFDLFALLARLDENEPQRHSGKYYVTTVVE